jgi:GAF domain-containing protein
MEANSTLDRRSAADTKPVGAAEIAALHPEQAVSQNISDRAISDGTTPASVSAALAAARAETTARLASGSVASGSLPSAGRAASVRFPGEDGGHSLAEMAQRDLDAALQLLADRAQYITGASGAAIAIRRDGRNDMLCRASAGMNAPELGALLSTEFGLSGESVRTRQALRCDDAERDKRVNRDVCREMGIASVVVMPVVNDDEVLGVFELFSGKANAFGARDVSAVQRLSEMVETAVRLAQAAENFPERLRGSAISGLVVEEVDEVEVEVQEDQVLEEPARTDVVMQDQVTQDQALQDQVRRPIHEERPGTSGTKALTEKKDSIAALEARRQPKTSPAISPETSPVSSAEASPEISLESSVTKKKLFWSSALNPVAEAGGVEEPDQSHVPPVLRSLRKCAACGFPVSAGRMHCVECEEKKWRGQLKPISRREVIPGSAAEAVSKSASNPVLPEMRAFAAAQSGAVSTSASTTRSASTPLAASGSGVDSLPVGAKEGANQPISGAPAKRIESAAAAELVAETLEIPASVPASPLSVQPVLSSVPAVVASPKFVLSAGLEPSQSWLAANKYVVGVLLVIAAAVAAAFLLR